MTSRYKDVLRFALKGDFEAARQEIERLGHMGWTESAAMIGAAFAMAVERRFPQGASRSDVTRFVEEARSDFAGSDEEIRPLMAEALIRSVLGEPHLMKEISRSESIPVQMALTQKIVADEEMSSDDIDRFLDEAEQLADRWTAPPTT